MPSKAPPETISAIGAVCFHCGTEYEFIEIDKVTRRYVFRAVCKCNTTKQIRRPVVSIRLAPPVLP